MYNYSYNKSAVDKLNTDKLYVRLNRLNDSSLKNVVIIKDCFDTSTFRYRGYNVCETMANSEKYTVEMFLVKECEHLFSSRIDLIVLQRAQWSFELQNFISFFKGKTPIVYDMDDLIYDSKYLPEYIQSIGKTNDSFLSSIIASTELYSKIIKQCDGIITTTEPLKAFLENDFNVATYVFPNYLNNEQIEISERVRNIKSTAENNGRFCIGYFSGSNSHARDFAVAQSALLKMMQKYDDVDVLVLGHLTLSEEWNTYKENGRLIFKEFVNYRDLQYEIGTVDLNIIPLQRHRFNECKSELKYFEASIVDVPSLASNNTVYSSVIKHGVDGFLSDELSWLDNLEYIYNNRFLLKAVTDSAREKCLKKYSSLSLLPMIENIYDLVLG